MAEAARSVLRLALSELVAAEVSPPRPGADIEIDLGDEWPGARDVERIRNLAYWAHQVTIVGTNHGALVLVEREVNEFLRQQSAIDQQMTQVRPLRAVPRPVGTSPGAVDHG